MECISGIIKFETSRKSFQIIKERGAIEKGMVLWQAEKTAKEEVCIQEKVRERTVICTAIWM